VAGGNQPVDGTTQPCPLTECAALISCLDGRNFAVKGIDAEVVGGPPAKPTDEQGAAEFEHLKPPDKDYTAKVTLSGDLLKKYVWKDKDGATADLTQFIAGADEVLYRFRLVCLARPKVKVVWQEDNKAIGDVGVKFQQADADKYTLSNTKKEDGIAALAEGDPGVKPGDYTVAFPTGIEHCVVVEGAGISIEEASTATFVFHVKKFFVGFELRDQFDNEISGLNWVMRYPDGAKKDTGKFEDTDKGLVKKDQIPDGNYTFSVKAVFGSAWGATPLVIGQDVKLSANATGFDPNTEMKFEIFDACVPSGTALDTVTGKTVEDPNTPLVEVTWKPDAEKLKKVMSGAVIFVASVETSKTYSTAAAIGQKQAFDVKDSAGHSLETMVDFTFSGG
jgi:hypothetical protein